MVMSVLSSAKLHAVPADYEASGWVDCYFKNKLTVLFC
jgi:hypothetical protein